MKRTQIYLSTEQWETLHAMSFRTNQSMSDLIRAALDRKYLCAKPTNFGAGMRAAFGMWKDRSDMGNTAAYVRALRKGTRMGRLLRLRRKPHA